MLFKTLPLFLTIGTALAMMPLKPRIDSDRSLVDFMLMSRGVGSSNPALNQYCFNRYLPILKDITDQYEADYGKCVDTYKAECEAIDVKYYEPRENFAATAKETCDALLKCDGNVNYVDAFDCFASTGSEYSKKLFTLSSDAGEYGGIVRELYRAAETVAEFCANYAERVYWENTDSTYAEMQKCLNGDIVEPSTTPSTTIRATTSTPFTIIPTTAETETTVV